MLCYEDAAQYGRSYPNDCLYVYTPEEGNESNAEGERTSDERRDATNDEADENGDE